MIQVSSDGLNKNLAFLDIVNNKQRHDELSQLINIGICWFHTVHNSFKHSEKASGWKMNKLLSSTYNIFDEYSSWHVDYEQLTSAISSDYLLQLCFHRWVENDQVFKKATEIFEKIKEIALIFGNRYLKVSSLG